LIEIICGIEGGVADEFIGGAVPRVGAGLRGDNDLAARMLSEFGAVRISLDVKFADGINAEELPTGTAGGHVVFGRAGVLDAVEEEDVLLGAIAGHGKIVRGGGIGDAGAAGLLRGEIDDARIEGEKKIEAAAVQGKLLGFLSADQTGDVAGGGVYDGSISGDGDCRLHRTHPKPDVNGDLLIDVQVNSASREILKAGLGRGDLIKANGESTQEVSPIGLCGSTARDSSFGVFGGDSRRWDAGSRGVGDRAPHAGGHLAERCCRPAKQNKQPEKEPRSSQPVRAITQVESQRRIRPVDLQDVCSDHYVLL